MHNNKILLTLKSLSTAGYPELDDRRVLVTVGTKGIGKAIVGRLLNADVFN
jgi:hypothetical protein